MAETIGPNSTAMMSAARAAVEALKLDPVFGAAPLARMTVLWAERTLDEPVHPAHAADLDTEVARVVRAQRAKLEGELNSALAADLCRVEYALSAWKQAPPARDVYGVVRNAVAQLGGNSMLANTAASAARSAAARGLQVGPVSNAGVEIDRRVVPWTELIEGARPPSWSRVETWRGQYGMLPDDPAARPVAN